MATSAQLSAADRLREIVKSQPGGARCCILSQERCYCGLCDIDRLMERPSFPEKRDTQRLDWLESEMERETKAIADQAPLPRSLFRRNMPITRAMIDKAMSVQEA